MRRDWKRIQPNSLITALRLCKDYAIERKRLSVERIADLMGVTHDSLYKWLSTGRMPALLIPVYENTCGIQFVTKWLAASSGKLIIDIPTGKTASVDETQALQGNLTLAVSSLIQFYQGTEGAESTLAAIQTALEDLAGHRSNVSTFETPQLDFKDEDF